MSTLLPRSQYKLVFLGDGSVGKTSIITRFMYDDKFDSSYKATVGIDFLSKTMYLEDRFVRFMIWDTAGQERFHSLIPSYIRDSQVAVVCYDISSRCSFLNVKKWINDIRTERGSDILIFLVGNKNDLNESRQVSVQDGENRANEWNLHFIETSAKNGHNIKNLFHQISLKLPGSQTTSILTQDIDIPLSLNNQNSTQQTCYC